MVRPYTSAALTTDSELPEWSEIKLHNALKKALVALEFQKPTDIQTRSLPFALDGRDIVGVAETVSHSQSFVTGVDNTGIR
jgi:superfamily II DNA/RNA helicase